MTCTDPRDTALGLRAATRAKGRAEVTEPIHGRTQMCLSVAPVTLMSHAKGYRSKMSTRQPGSQKQAKTFSNETVGGRRELGRVSVEVPETGACLPKSLHFRGFPGPLET